MNEWIKQEAERIRNTEGKRSDDRAWQRYKAELIVSKWQEHIWEPIVQAVKQDCKDFASQFPGESAKQLEACEIPSRGLIIRKSYFPAVTVEIIIDERKQTIDYHVRTIRNYNSSPVERHGSLQIDIDNEILCVKSDNVPMIPSEISKYLLKPIFESFT